MQTSSDDVTFVMATYNRAGLLPRALFSLLHQQRPATEVLVVDDASTDNTWEVLQNWAVQYPQLRVFHRTTNSGGYHGQLINGLLSHCQTPWYMVHSDDDGKRLNCLEVLVAAAEDYDVVYGDSFLHNAPAQRSQDWDPQLLRHHNYIDIGEALVRTHVWEELGGYDGTLVGATDWEFWLRLTHAPGQYRVKHVPVCITDYYFHDQMMTRRPDHHLALQAIKEKYRL